MQMLTCENAKRQICRMTNKWIPADCTSGSGAQAIAVQVFQSIPLHDRNHISYAKPMIMTQHDLAYDVRISAVVHRLTQTSNNGFAVASDTLPLWHHSDELPKSAELLLCQKGSPTIALTQPWQSPCPAPV